MPQSYSHPLDYLRVLRRRKWWFTIPALLCIAGGIAAARLWPPTYKTVATVAVQAPTVTPDLVAQRAVLNTEDRLRALTQQLRSPSVLERVVREEALATDRPVDAVVQELHARITIEPMKPITRTEAVATLNAFDIVYRDSTPERTQRVADRLAAVFVDEHSRSRAVQAEGTTEFLRTQLQSSQERITNLEKQLRRVKELHMGQLPEQTEANMQALGALRQQLDTTGNNLRYEQDRLSFIERQIQAVRQGAASAPAAASASGGAPSPQQRINTLQRDLAAARSKYTDKHPEVLALEDELKIARAEAAALRGQSDSSREEQLGTDPVYQQLTSDRSMAEARIRNLQRAEGQLRSDMARYQGRVEAAPMVEQEMAATQREYDLERENYKNLSERHTAAQMQAQLAEQRGGERFSVLNKASLPESPESPNRLTILLFAIGAGLILGGSAALGRDYLDPAVRDARSLQDQFDVPVLAEIPRIREVA
jgi:polysaccharide chain length determinant protein (PEP-CTERM system associated)